MIIKENEFKTLTGYTLKELKIDFLNRIKPSSIEEGENIYDLSLDDLSLIIERVKDLTKEEIEYQIVTNQNEEF